MIGFVFALLLLFRGLRRALRHEEFRGIALAMAIYVAAGTFIYSAVEDWSLLNSLYFSVVILTTVGLGDFAPVTAAGKMFTVAYLIFGVGLTVAFVTSLGSSLLEERNHRLAERVARRGRPVDS